CARDGSSEDDNGYYYTGTMGYW
nr:immunoglobulin heavy chain junction region [Macaca mulatta]MOV49512.1 immunoglobulin heavy chain junction region [Macaca mulatta]MOV49879.1 immunoglobulin heavy chain junction region [Macaca mulatta]MOV50073.1 immunoglobulin heavy chain junction region [Macaca mulatta]MOV50340.1 immunoglobulin heavy chain junction region [Macaca mulatta]